MDQASTQTIAMFTGTLLRREHMLGQRFVQLVFREGDKNWLCLSSNLPHAAKLQIGKNYKIEGAFKQLGERPYIHEPNIAPLARQIAKRRVGISLIIALALLLPAGGIVLAASHKQGAPTTPPDTYAAQQAPANDTSQAKTDTPVATPEVTPTDTAATPAPAAAAPTVPKTTPVTTTPAPAQPAPAAPVTPPADTTAPTAPTNPNAVAVSSSEITVTWSAASDDVAVAGYRVYRGDTLIATVTGTAYGDTGLSPSTTYSYTVVAFDAAGNISTPASADGTTLEVT